MGSEVTSKMIEAGLAAYARLAWHDDRSPGSPEEVVRAIIAAALDTQAT